MRFITPVEDSIIYLTDFYINSKQAGTFNELWPSITPQPFRAPLTASETANPGQGPALNSVSVSTKFVQKKIVIPDEIKKMAKEIFTINIPI